MKIDGTVFFEGQQVIVLNMLINDERVDFGGFVQGWGRGKTTKHQLEVKVNGVSLYFPKERLVDYELYWIKKHAEANKPQ